MRSIFVTLAFLLCLLPPSHARAAIVAECGMACDAETAKYLGDGEHILYDISNGQIHQYQVTGWGERPINAGDSEGVYVLETTLPGSIQTAFNFAKQIYQQNGSTSQPVSVHVNQLTDLPNFNQASVFDVIGDATIRTQIEDRLGRPLPGLSQVDAIGETLIQSALAYLGLADKVEIEITLVFADGATAVFVRDGTGGAARYQKGRSRTPSNQVIPEQIDSASQGVWTAVPGTGDSLDDLVVHMANLGAQISFSGSGERVVRLTCTWTVMDGETSLSCVPLLE